MRRGVALLALGLAAAAGLARAQAPAPGPASGDVASLQAFAGHWDCNGAFANGKAIGSFITATWDAATQSLLFHQDDKPPGAFHAVELWTAGDGAGLRAAIADRYSGERWLESPGWVDDKLTWTRFAGPKPMERFVFSRPNERGFFIEWFPLGKDGAFVLGDRLACKALAA
jgi:hypothetical protein